jgi:L-fucose mutarotase/ribose pyranase (RbsD/FucU family)
MCNLIGTNSSIAGPHASVNSRVNNLDGIRTKSTMTNIIPVLKVREQSHKEQIMELMEKEQNDSTNQD